MIKMPANMREGPPDVCKILVSHPDKVSSMKEKVIEAAGLSELFQALADEMRTKILYLLSFGELCVCDLAEILETSLPAVSHHLRLLKMMRLVKYHRDGKMVQYSLADDHVLRLIQVAQEHYEEER